MKLTTHGWFTWFTKDDQYSKQQLTADSRRALVYLNRGISSSTSSRPGPITPDARRSHHTRSARARLPRGRDEVQRRLIVKEEEPAPPVTVKQGDVFSREKIARRPKR